MNYKIFKNTYRIPVNVRDKLVIPSYSVLYDYVKDHDEDSRQCIFETIDSDSAIKKWSKLKNSSLFIPAPFPYVLIEKYELEETNLSNFVSFMWVKEIEDVSNNFYTREDLDKLTIGIKLDRKTRELAEKQKMEEINNAKRRR